ncbi:hypothetical protein [Microvirga arabica]|uniref:hypothetical protein n=1 Tax=Microvirga arabica TaxID=1128671 RepID=UPI00193ABFE4|nr:hypothetical protein [Microvirga arabica]MBM1175251.1 hypothetical protein [Microvirga arabica]
MRKLPIMLTAVVCGLLAPAASTAQDHTAALGNYVCVSETVVGIQYKEAKGPARKLAPYYAGAITAEALGDRQFFLQVKANDEKVMCSREKLEGEMCNKRFRIYVTAFLTAPEVAYGDSPYSFYAHSGNLHMSSDGTFHAARYFEDTRDSYLAHGRCEKISYWGEK